MGGVTLPILNVGRPFAVEREFRTVSKMPGSSLFLTVAISTVITALETLLLVIKVVTNKRKQNIRNTALDTPVGIDWIGIVMLSGQPLVLTEVIDEEWPGFFT